MATIITYLLRPREMCLNGLRTTQLYRPFNYPPDRKVIRIYINIYTREKINTPIPLHTAFAGLIAGPRNGGKKFWYVIDITNK